MIVKSNSCTCHDIFLFDDLTCQANKADIGIFRYLIIFGSLGSNVQSYQIIINICGPDFIPRDLPRITEGPLIMNKGSG